MRARARANAYAHIHTHTHTHAHADVRPSGISNENAREFRKCHKRISNCLVILRVFLFFFFLIATSIIVDRKSPSEIRIAIGGFFDARCTARIISTPSFAVIGKDPTYKRLQELKNEWSERRDYASKKK